jgi:hypothetical protein
MRKVRIMAGLIELVYEKSAVNPALLHEELAVALGNKLAGISTGQGKVRVHVLDTIQDAERALIEPIILAHDSKKLTAGQQAEADQAAKMNALSKPWASWTAVDKDELLRLLAEKLGIGVA